MFRKKNRQVQKEEITISLEKLVPENHILRAIDKAIDFSFIYEEVEELYSDKGRPGTLIRSVFSKSFLFNICSGSVQCARR